MHHNKILIVLIVALPIFGCHLRKGLVGRYCSSQDLHGPDRTEIVLKADGTFFGESWSDVAGSFTTKGNWKIGQQQIFLEYQPWSFVDTVTFSRSNNLIEKSRIRVIDAKKKVPLKGLGLKISVGDKSYYIDDKEYVDIDFGNANNLTVEFLQTTEAISLEHTKNYEVNIYLQFVLQNIVA